jgi:hypothetical protein
LPYWELHPCLDTLVNLQNTSQQQASPCPMCGITTTGIGGQDDPDLVHEWVKSHPEQSGLTTVQHEDPPKLLITATIVAWHRTLYGHTSQHRLERASCLHYIITPTRGLQSNAKILQELLPTGVFSVVDECFDIQIQAFALFALTTLSFTNINPWFTYPHSHHLLHTFKCLAQQKKSISFELGAQ